MQAMKRMADSPSENPHHRRNWRWCKGKSPSYCRHSKDSHTRTRLFGSKKFERLQPALDSSFALENTVREEGTPTA